MGTEPFRAARLEPALLRPALDRLGQAVDVGHVVVDLGRDADVEAVAPGVDLDLDRILEEEGVAEGAGLLAGLAESGRGRHRPHGADHPLRAPEGRPPGAAVPAGAVTAQRVVVS